MVVFMIYIFNANYKIIHHNKEIGNCSETAKAEKTFFFNNHHSVFLSVLQSV